MKHKVAIALSGGVDSLVAAHILKSKGYEVFGVHFLTGYTPYPNLSLNNRYTDQLISYLKSSLGIEVYVYDYRKEFQKQVIDYFVDTYQAGKTPNPCIQCNATIKFGIMMDKAMQLDSDHLATGHYANINKDKSGTCHLLKGFDLGKDQSYFLSRLSQRQLSYALFPLSGYTKDQTRQYAEKKGLTPFTKAESQDICFIPSNNYSAFLEKQKGFDITGGPIKDTDGNIIGRHTGLYHYTIGQRRGINCPAPEAYYVVKLDVERNCLVVGFKDALLKQTCLVKNINWIHTIPEKPVKLHIRIRYHHTEVPSTVIPVDNQTARIEFETPQSAVTPGQGAVFYKGDEILGGGWIDFE
ncbi:MAG: tRNA 2-thiouridine(34) synthase MnmA [Desulfobacterales bacterium]|nr:tRNA 2-thiouridine(34) synthase MnmA [Desulfobacterales bacterium]